MRKRIRLDWSELRDAFADTAGEHRYYLDRETGAVHFFSTYLDNDEEKEDEQLISSDGRYARIPLDDDSSNSRRHIEEFIRTLGNSAERQSLRSATETSRAEESFMKALSRYPTASRLWARYCEEKLDARIEQWLGRVGVEPLE